MSRNIKLVITQIDKTLPPEWHKKYNRRIKTGIENRLKLCVNIAIAIDTIHKTKNIVLVDLKPQNILITHDAKVSIIDLDSIQIAHAKSVDYPAKVATPEYTPKEGKKLNPATDFIPETWDRFSLAVVFYEILFGIHPYASTSGGQYAENTTIAEKIGKNLFVHGSKRGYLTFIAPIHKNYDLLPNSLQALFLRAFETGSSKPSDRPNAEVWGQTIVEALKNSNIVANTTIVITKQKNIIQEIPKTIQKKPTPVNPPITTANKPHINSQNDFMSVVAIVVISLFFITMIYLSIVTSNKSTVTPNNNSSSIDSFTVDTTMFVDTAMSVDTTMVIVDTTYTPTAPESQTLGSTFPSNSNENINTPENITKIFLISLNDSDCETAWNNTYNPKWERKGKEWFCSTEAYGGVNRVDIYILKEVENYGNESIVFAKYYAEDSYNGNAEYLQTFILKRIQKRWVITDVRNIEK